jgi:hemoglobin
MVAHLNLHARAPLSAEHFDKWLALFDSTADELFEGESAEEIKKRAFAIAATMQYKLRSRFPVVGAEPGPV